MKAIAIMYWIGSAICAVCTIALAVCGDINWVLGIIKTLTVAFCGFFAWRLGD